MPSFSLRDGERQLAVNSRFSPFSLSLTTKNNHDHPDRSKKAFDKWEGGISECVEHPNIVEWEEEAVGKGGKTSKKLCWLWRSPAVFVFVVPFQAAPGFGFQSESGVVSCVCCPWYPRIQPNLSTPAKKTKKAEMFFHQVLTLSQIAKQINAEKQKDTQSMVLVVRFDGSMCRGIDESDRRDDAFLLVSLTVEGGKYDEK